MTEAWKTVRVFISSTFRDMQAERDHLVRFVFPRLREELLPRRIHLVDVDLRWGVTSEQDASDVCREVINECRPRFLCILGGRYGWVPPGKSRSITADEVYYGVIDRTLNDRGFTCFYFRDDAVTAAMAETTPGEFREPPGSDHQQHLATLKQAIVATGLHPCTYSAQWDDDSRRLTGLKPFGDRVYDDLLDGMTSDPDLRDRFVTAAAAPVDEFADERTATEAFIEERNERFVLGSREAGLNALLAHAGASGGNGCVCLTGAPGSGKSALLAHLCRRLTTAGPEPVTGHPRLVIPHFVGASAGSTDVRRTLRRLCHELKAGCADITADIPDDPEKLRVAFPAFLRQASARQRVVILLDAVNQFDLAADAAGLSWLPEDLPADARVILSALDGPALDELRRRARPPREIELTPLTAADGEAIIEQFLRRYSKKFEPDQRAALLAKTDAGMPLYVLTALEELRTLGTYEAITGRIAELPSSTQELFAWMLERLEDDDGFRNAAGRRVGRELVTRFAALMGASRYGLSQRELTDLLDQGDPHGNVAALLHLLRPCLMRRGELLDFYHGQFREAATEAWLKTDAQRQAAHARLAGYFRAQSLGIEHERAATPNLRKLSELPHHLLRCGDLRSMGELVRSEFLELKAGAFGEPDAIADAGKIAEALAEAGAQHWDDLVRCAWTYCELTERLHAKPESLEVLIRRGEISRVLAAIESEPDESRQAMLRLAVSVLLAEAGHAQVAREMRRRAMAVAGPRLGVGAAVMTETSLNQLHEYPFELRCLGRALSEIPLAPAGNPQPPGPGPASVPGETAETPCTTVPFKDVCLAYFSDSYRARLMFLGWVGGLMVTGLGLRVYYPPLLPFVQTGVGKAVVIGLFVLAAFGPLLLQAFSASALTRNPDRIDRVVGGMLHAARDASPRNQRRILIRALRYLSLLGSARGWGLWSPELARLIARQIEGDADPKCAAAVLCEATGMSDHEVDAVIAELRQVSPAQLERIYGAVATHPSRLRSAWQFFRIIVGTSDLVFEPERLLQFITTPPDRTGITGPEEEFGERFFRFVGIPGSGPKRSDTVAGIGPEVRLLQQAGALVLARALLAGVRRGTGTTSAAGKILATAQSGLETAWRHSGALRSPVSLAEPLLWCCVSLPTGLGFFLLFAPITAFVAVLMAMIMLLGRTQDAFRMWQWLPRAGSVWPQRDRIERTSEEPSFSTSETGLARRCGFIPEALLARAIVTRDLVEWRKDSAESEGQRRRVLSALVGTGVLGRRGDVVLSTMGNRQLLQAATTVREKVGRKRPVRALAPSSHERQVTSVLPLASPWVSVCLVLMLSLPVTLAWAGLASRLRTADAEMQGLLYALFALGTSAYFSVVQHVARLPRTRFSDELYFWFWFKGMVSFFVGFFLTAFTVTKVRAIPIERIYTTPLAFLMLGPLVITNFLVPEFIARWRGGGLLYPTRTRLWLERLAALGVLGVACCVLAWIAAVVP